MQNIRGMALRLIYKVECCRKALMTVKVVPIIQNGPLGRMLYNLGMVNFIKLAVFRYIGKHFKTLAFS